MDQQDISSKNSNFWNELCGSQLARLLGIKDASETSLKKFDDWYFNFYPYLQKHIPFENLKNAKVLEVGLGYGSVSQKLAESGSIYVGLDIAEGPVSMVNHRLAQNNLKGTAFQGSILKSDFPPESFDAIVAIGCLHHTGDLKQAIDECWKLLRPGGSLIMMVYYAYSYRRFRMAPFATFKYFFKELFLGYRGVVGRSADGERAAYDSGSTGEAAPHTDWISIKSLQNLCSNYTQFNATVENIDQEKPFQFVSRDKLLSTFFPSLMGLDLYATVKK